MRALFAGFILFAASLQCMAATPLEIDAVTARLYYAHTGTLSKPIGENSGLWNTIIGGGGAEEPSNATLIEAVVSGKAGDYVPATYVDLLVTDTKTKKRIGKQSEAVGVLSNTGRFHLGFWLRDTGCTPLTITATLRGSSEKTTIRVPFECGE
jgi:hypothetical protein